MAVIIVTVVSITVIGAITIMTSLILYSMSGWRESVKAEAAATSLADDYLIRLIRDPELTPSPGEELQINGAIARVTYTPAQAEGQPHILMVRGTSGDYVRSIQILYAIENDEVILLSRQEVY